MESSPPPSEITRAVVDDLVAARMRDVATLPADDDELGVDGLDGAGWAAAAAYGVGRAALLSGREKREQLVELGGLLIGWIEAVDRELDPGG